MKGILVRPDGHILSIYHLHSETSSPSNSNSNSSHSPTDSNNISSEDSQELLQSVQQDLQSFLGR